MFFALKSWAILLWRMGLYFLYRLGLRARPTMMDVRDEVAEVCNHVLRWDAKMRIVGLEHFPKEGPAIFAVNHQQVDDPFCMYRAIYLGSGKRWRTRAMMREGFFDGTPFHSRLIDGSELLEMVGAILIQRDQVSLAQIKPFIHVLHDRESFIIFPGRSRTRSGVFMEYREGIEEPGSVGFLIALAQRQRPDLRVAAVPVARTINPVTGKYTVAFGESLFLEPNADRARQREFDYDLITRMGNLVEINVPQVLAAFLYLWCLQQMGLECSVSTACEAVRTVVSRMRGRMIHPDAVSDPDREARRTLKYLERKGCLRLQGENIQLIHERILSSPPWDGSYKKLNPVKHLANQILHLADVVSEVERVAEKFM